MTYNDKDVVVRMNGEIIQGTTDNPHKACFCIGPQGDDELCPCMKKEREVVRQKRNYDV